MCGIGGFLFNHSKMISNHDERIRILKSMSLKQKSRGPDNEGLWSDEKKIYLFHRRLSILDLSSNGNQPMVSQNRRYVISYNGEIYNFSDLSIQLKKDGVFFKGRSDTEVILESISKWGIKLAVKKFIGMFAIAIWDKKYSKLHLIRDRLGIKPLYWAVSNNCFLFSSTIDSIITYPNLSKKINQQSLDLYLSYGYIKAPFTIFENIKKVNPGTILSLSLDNEPKETIYWSVREKVIDNKNKIFSNYNDCKRNLEKLIEESVSMRMVSDVPLGSFLSGGIDSSIVTALMQKQTSRKINTFSIGFKDNNFDEAQDAKKLQSI